MEENKAILNNLTEEFRKLDYPERSKLFSYFFSSGTIDLTNYEFESKLKLMHYIAYTTFKVREKFPNLTCKDVIEQIMQRKIDPNGDAVDSYLIGICIICDDLLYGVTEMDAPDGMTTSQQLIEQIKYFIGRWLPF